MAGNGLWAALLAVMLWLGPGVLPAGAAVPEQLVSAKGELPRTGRIVIRSGLAWMREDDPLFVLVARALAGELEERGLAVAVVEPSVPAPLPPDAERLKTAPVPKSKGVRRRIMSVAEAVSRMKAMQLAREGRLPQSRFSTGDTGTSGASRSAPPANGSGTALSRQEMARFALSQEEGDPELRGQITVPGRVPGEVRSHDPAVAEYALVVRFAMLWPASGIPDSTGPSEAHGGLAVGWHLLEMDCYDLAPAREGKAAFSRILAVAVQRVAFGPYLRGTLPRMARDAVTGRR